MQRSIVVVLCVQSGLGSYGVMDRKSVPKAYDVSFGASVSQRTPLDKDEVST